MGERYRFNIREGVGVFVMSATERLPDGADAVAEDVSSVESLSTDEIFHLLQSRRRRAVLRYLRDVEGPVEMRAIAEQVAAWENDTSPQAISSDERQRVYIPLYQSHLPKLDEEGIIEYDKDRGVVRKTPLAAQLVRYLDVDDPAPSHSDRSRRWGSYYLGVSGVGTVLFVGALLDVALFSLLPVTVVVGLVLGAFWLVTLGHSVAE
jgi:DNA-binding transcriptional ArsR family regulator